MADVLAETRARDVVPLFRGPRRPLPFFLRAREGTRAENPRKGRGSPCSKGRARVLRRAASFLPSFLSARASFFSPKLEGTHQLLLLYSGFRTGITASPLLRALFARRFEILHGLLLIRKRRPPAFTTSTGIREGLIEIFLPMGK